MILKLCLKSAALGVLTSIKSFITSIKRIIVVLCYKNADNLEGIAAWFFLVWSSTTNFFLIFSPLKKVFVIPQ